jgi:replicative DNA helicase
MQTVINDEEQCVLAHALVSTTAAKIVVEELKASAFKGDLSRDIFEAMFALHSIGSPVDFATVGNHLAKEKGDASYRARVFEISNIGVMPSVFDLYLRQLKNVVLGKRINGQLQKAQSHWQNEEPSEFYSAVREILKTEYEQNERIAVPASELIDSAMLGVMDRMDYSGAMIGSGTGFGAVDSILGGFAKDDYVLIGGNPSAGKTMFGLNVALNLAVEYQMRTCFVSLEMSRDALVQRLLAMHSSMHLQSIRKGTLHNDECRVLLNSLPDLPADKILIADNAEKLGEIKNLAKHLRQIVAFEKPDLIVIDYIQLIKGDPDAQNRNIEVQDVSRQIKQLCKELQTPIMGLAQLSRANSQRADKKPMLSDLRDSGGLEQDADIILLLYREKYYKPESSNEDFEVLIRKNRNGPCGDARLCYREQSNRLLDITGTALKGAASVSNDDKLARRQARCEEWWTRIKNKPDECRKFFTDLARKLNDPNPEQAARWRDIWDRMEKLQSPEIVVDDLLEGYM